MIFNYSLEHLQLPGYCKHLSVKRTPSYSWRQANTKKGTPKYFSKIAESLPQYLILQGFPEFILLIKTHNTSIWQTKKNIFNEIPNFANISLPSREQLFFSADVVLSRKNQIPRQEQEHTSEDIYYRTAPSNCFCLQQHYRFQLTSNQKWSH